MFCNNCVYEDSLDAAKTLPAHLLCLETMVADLQAAEMSQCASVTREV